MFILSPDSIWNTLESSFPVSSLLLTLSVSLFLPPRRERVRVLRSAQYPTETQVEETDRHIEDCQPAEIKADREEMAALQQTDFKRKKMERWLKEKPGYIKVQAKLRCPNQVQWSSVNWDALFFFLCTAWYTAAPQSSFWSCTTSEKMWKIEAFTPSFST